MGYWVGGGGAGGGAGERDDDAGGADNAVVGKVNGGKVDLGQVNVRSAGYRI